MVAGTINLTTLYIPPPYNVKQKIEISTENCIFKRGDLGGLKGHFFCLKGAIISNKGNGISKTVCCSLVFVWEHYLTCSLGYGQAEFSQDLFHILPYLSAVIVRVVAEQVGRVEGGHKFYGFVAYAGDIFVEYASQLAYCFRRVQNVLAACAPRATIISGLISSICLCR